MFDLFQNEDEILAKAIENIENFSTENTLLFQEYKALAKAYRKLLIQTKRVVKMGDKQQFQLSDKADKAYEITQQNRKVFGRYLSDEIVDKILESETGLSLGGERREITILTSDIRGFTEKANQLLPEQVIKIVNHYLAAMTEVISQYNGTIDEFMGDGILVLFGAPVARSDDTDRAVACAIAMQLAMDKANKQLIDWGFMPLEMGIGVHTGEVVVGNIGSEKRTKYGVIGNEVNLVYRIESNTQGGQILISEPTYKQCKNIVKVCSNKKIKAKGIREDIIVYEVEGIKGQYNLFLQK